MKILTLIGAISKNSINEPPHSGTRRMLYLFSVLSEIYFSFSAYVNDKGELADSSKKVFENYFAAFKACIENNSPN